jgi:glycosyltransferase involved in cell wall biosynthesis
MGVDSAFVRRRSGPSVTRDVAEEDFVLAVGTNEGKDYGTLLEALPLGKKLVVVTDAYNARLITHHRCFGTGIEVRQNVPIHQLRSLYQSAKLIVLPLHDTVYGSGHTVFLENLALGKVMLVSQSRGMEGYARGGENCVTVPVGGTVELRNAIQSVMKDSQTYSRLGEAAAADADERFSVSRYAVEMVGILKTVRRRVAAAGGLVSEELAGANSREDGKHASV